MRQELSKHIATLLYEVERLSIPNLGSFELAPASALVDQVQGQVSAPAKNITFNSNLVLDDGLLVDHLVVTNNWPLAEAKAWIQAEVDTILASLDRREIVELSGVGRFFRNFEGKLQFVTDNVNYNVEAFGLQAVYAQPVARTAHEKANIPGIKLPPPVAATAVAGSSLSAELADWFQRNMLWLLGVSLLLLSLVVFLLFLQPKNTTDNDIAAQLPQERLNASPSKQPDTATEPIIPNETTDSNTADSNTADTATEAEQVPSREVESAPPPTANDPVDTEAPTLAPNEHTAIIAVGLFGNPDNVQKKVALLSRQGFSPYTAQEGGNTRVGVNVRYEQESELRKVLRDIKRLHTKSAFVLFKDGVSQR